MRYEVRVVEDHQLPQSSDWAIVTAGGEAFLFLKRSKFQNPRVLAHILTSAWVAWQQYAPTPPLLAAAV